jgi:hypothetical protein
VSLPLIEATVFDYAVRIVIRDAATGVVLFAGGEGHPT